MFGAQQVASMFGVLDLRDNMTPALDRARRGLETFTGGLQTSGMALAGVGAGMAAFAAPVVGALGLATNRASAFQEALVNVQSITQQSNAEIEALGDQLLEIGSNSRFGAQQISNAYYDIVSGVADASTHMDILNAAVSTAQAGNAELGGTLNAVVSAMNSYNYEAEQASFVSDVLTRTVQVGVGSMDEFAAALPIVTGLAAPLGIGLEDVGAALSYMTTRGFSAAQSATQLRAMITALLNPNERMRESLAEIGVTSGEAAIEQYGLAGAFAALSARSDTFQNNMAAATGSVEALTGVMTLGGAEDALEDFAIGLDGVTAAAEDIQLESVAAQTDMLNAQLETLQISLGRALLPTINQAIETIRPFLSGIIDWVSANPELIAQIGLIAGGVAAVGAVLAPLGLVISGLGAVIGLIASPIGIVVAAIAGLGVAFATNFGGIRDFVEQQVLPRLRGFFEFLGGVWNNYVQPAVTRIYTWFVMDGLPAIQNVVENSIRPALESFFGFIGQVWEIVRPALESLGSWFLNDALPAILNFVENTVIPGIGGFVDLLRGFWDQVSPGLLDLVRWFTEQGLPGAVDFVENTVIPVIEGLAFILGGIWEWAKPGLEGLARGIGSIFGWIRDNVLTPFLNFIGGIFSEINRLGQEIGRVLGMRSQVTETSAFFGTQQLGIRPFGGSRDNGGEGRAGVAYAIGIEAQPELFVPNTNGTFYPRDQWMGNGAQSTEVSVNITVTEGSARRAGLEFGEGLRQRLRENG